MATRFRNDLLDMGYLMMQYSVYARCAVTLEKKESIVSELEKIVPPSGNIHGIYITDAQWHQSMVFHKAPEKKKREIDKNDKMGDQLQFW